MSESTSEKFCPCGSGYLFSDCCGVAGRTAVNADVVASITHGGLIERKSLTTELREGVERFSAVPDLLPARISFAENKAWYVKMSPEWYLESVFLDPARMRGTCVLDSDLEWLDAVCQQIPFHTSSLIFHTAFCGSTLMSQALERMFNCLSLREPEILGNVLVYMRSNNVVSKQAKPDVWLGHVVKLLSRRYYESHSVVIKANDYANPIMNEIVKHRYNTPILFMYTPLNEFLAGCLKAENRRQWVAQRYQAVSKYAVDVLDYPENFIDSEKTTGELAAVYWSYNIALYLQAWRDNEKQVRSLEFNRMLASPLESVQSCGSFFNLERTTDIPVSRTIADLLGVYSKNSKFNYSPQQREQDIQRILDDNRKEVEAAEILSKRLLGDQYPEHNLPGQLLII